MTDLDTKRENLSKLLTFLKERIFSRTENRWFSEALLAELSPSCSDKISDIYEQCIESILTEQANEFYKDFVIDELRPQLIRDFIKMEHWRRRNDIGEFGMALYQQVECIVNHLSNDVVLDELCHSLQPIPCYIKWENSKINERYLPSPKEFPKTVKDLLFLKDTKSNADKKLIDLTAFYKFKCVNYFICHRACLIKQHYTLFKNENDILFSLYSLRNTNHRGNPSESYNTAELEKVFANPSRAYLTLIAFLTQFIDRINAGWPLSQDLIEFSKIDFSNIDYTRLS